MLVLRLSRHGRKNLATYRVVLSEHTKPVKFGYKEVLGSYDPIKHVLNAKVDIILDRIKKGAKPSERLAKILWKETKNDIFNTFIKHRERKGKTKKEDKK